MSVPPLIPVLKFLLPNLLLAPQGAGANASGVWGTHRPRTTAAVLRPTGAAPGVLTRAAAKSMLEGARSMTGMLQNCSEVTTRALAPPFRTHYGAFSAWDGPAMPLPPPPPCPFPLFF